MYKRTDNSAFFAKANVHRDWATAQYLAPALKTLTDRGRLSREDLATELNLQVRHVQAILVALESEGKVRRRNGLWELK